MYVASPGTCDADCELTPGKLQPSNQSKLTIGASRWSHEISGPPQSCAAEAFKAPESEKGDSQWCQLWQ